MGAGTGLEHVANADVLDELGVDSGLLDDGFQHGGEHGLGCGVFLGTFLGLGHRGAGEGEDNDVVVGLGVYFRGVEGLVVAQVVLENLETSGRRGLHLYL